MRYSDHEQRMLDQQSGAEMDRRAQRRICRRLNVNVTDEDGYVLGTLVVVCDGQVSEGAAVDVALQAVRERFARPQ